MNDDRKRQDQPRGGQGVLGDKQEFEKGETHDAAKDRQAKDGIGRMGGTSGQGGRPIDVD